MTRTWSSPWPRRIIFLMMLAVVGFVALKMKLCDRLFYYPSREVSATPDDLGIDVEEVELRAPGGPTLHGWWMPATGYARGTIVHCHGNAANLTNHAAFVTWLPDNGFNVLAFDYRGYGRSEGSVTREGTVADAIAAIDFALDRDPNGTVVYGQSLGGAVGLVATAQRPAVQAIAVESCFPSYRDMAGAAAPMLSPLVPFLISKGQDPVDLLDRIPPRPLLVIHGTADRVVPFAMGERLFALAAEPKTFYRIDGGTHTGAFAEDRDRFRPYLVNFFIDALSSGSR